jgi:hypothetical protein
MSFANETQFLKAFEVVLTSDMQVYLIATAIANIFLFIIVIGIVYYFCIRGAIHTALHRAVVHEIEQRRHQGENAAQYRSNDHMSLDTTRFLYDA